MTEPTIFEMSPETPVEDAVEQRQQATYEETGAGGPSAMPVEANEADVMEQAMEVGIDEDYDR
ncbi:MAG: hypothetical protein M3P91_03010 [Actinomycetota bacterium]|nr:hypothetical protein [Actinomycetota bacterium]